MIYFTPGPSELYMTIKKHIQEALSSDICSISHRSELYKSIHENCTQNLKKLFELPDDYHIFFLGSATEAMERIIENCVDQKSFHFINGAFSRRFFQIAQSLKKRAQYIEAEFGESFNLKDSKIPDDIELICITQNETSTGVRINPDHIHELKKRYPQKLLAVDIVSSAPYEKLDYSLIDCAFFSVQKCFGLPAGLGVLMVNDPCIHKASTLLKTNKNIGSYHNFVEFLSRSLKNQTPETPNVLDIYLLGRVCEDILSFGISRVRQETREKANLLYDFFDNHNILKTFIENTEDRSCTVIVANTGIEAKLVINKLASEGFMVGSGYGAHKNHQIRVANFPAHQKKDIISIINLMNEMDYLYQS